jgi:serine/threonine-protein kinase
MTQTHDPVAFDATIAVPSQGGAPSLAPSPARTTVLPRVEVVGAEPKLVVDGKRRFETTGKLGEGGLGEVTGARDNDIGRNVAVKRIKEGAKSAASALRFAEEVRTVGQLEHPNIVPIHDVGVDENGEYYFVMKYVEGETLEAVIDKLAAGDGTYHARYGVERRVQIFVGILEAVAFAHAKGIIHRDLKPANVMIGAYGEVVVMDWGIAKRTRDAAALALEPRAGEVVGTPAYMSPEQARGANIDVRSDVYSLSVMFHELLCLTHPLAAKQTMDDVLHAVQHEPVPHTSGVASTHQGPTPAELGWFVHKGVAKDPAARFQSVQEMIDRLDRRAEGKFPIQCPITFCKQITGGLTRFIDRRPQIVVMMLALFVLSFIAGIVLLVLRLR